MSNKKFLNPWITYPFQESRRVSHSLEHMFQKKNFIFKLQIYFYYYFNIAFDNTFYIMENF